MNHQRGSIAEGQPLTRFLSSRLSCIYGRGRPSQNTPSRARFESASHPFRVLSWTDFPEEFMHFPWWFWQGGGCVWEAAAAQWQIYNVFSAGCTSCHVLPPPCNRAEMFWLRRVQTAAGVFIYNIHPCCRHLILPLLTKTACAP